MDFMELPELRVSNEEFLRAIFGENAPYAHVTGFPDDPSAIAPDRRGICWGGTHYSRANGQLHTPGWNQYFTISQFRPDENGRPVRRKANFVGTYCIVADDVGIKIDPARAKLLPAPSWRMETSPGNQQWGWILDKPETDRARVENLLDGLVALGLSPDGTDPGMKGVTRYVRLPEGWNTKAKYGPGTRCKMLEWEPTRRASLEQLAAPFGVDLHARRADQGAQVPARVSQHPIFKYVQVLGQKAEGQYLIECPWIEEHADGDNSGTILYTNADRTLGFKCHHGHCQERQVPEFLDKLGARHDIDTWRAFDDIPAPDGALGGLAAAPGASPVVDFMMLPPETPAPPAASQPLWDQLIEALPANPLQDMERVRQIMRGIAQLSALEQGAALVSLRDRLRGFLTVKAIDQEMRAIKQQLKRDRLSGQGAHNAARSGDFAALCQAWVYVSGIDRFVNRGTLQMLTERAFGNRFCHLESEIEEYSESTGEQVKPDILRAALNGGLVKVDAVDYWPGKECYFWDRGLNHFNLWNHEIDQQAPGDVALWIGHFLTMGFSPEGIDHALDWMACTLQRPDLKINHILVLGGREGIGKDFLLEPLRQALGEHSKSIEGEDLASDFNEHLLRTKHLHINELEAANRFDRVLLTKKLKPLASSPPDRLSVNAKGVSKVYVRNVVNVSATTNDPHPVDLREGARRYYMLWSDVSIRGADGQMTPEWDAYWVRCWDWMRKHEGWRACVNYLMTRDLSRFDPRAVPKVTDHQREVVEASRSPLECWVRDRMEAKEGAFGFDLVTTERVFQHLQLAGETPLRKYGMKPPSLKGIGAALSGAGLRKLRVRWWEGSRQKEQNVYVIENVESYSAMTGSQILEILGKYPIPLKF